LAAWERQVGAIERRNAARLRSGQHFSQLEKLPAPPT
jgi:hypothetical protein